jgi:glycosyltransferase involved in cell wall biosynthesis
MDMIQDSDFVATVSPPAMASVAAYATALGHEEVKQRLILGPHPVSPLMRYQGEVKERRVIVVGRWMEADEAQKDPHLNMKVLRDFLHTHPDWHTDVIGRGSARLKTFISDWDVDEIRRLSLHDFLAHEQLIECYSRSRIMLCASRFESFHIASAEAVCCGCSVVVGKYPLLASTSWFTTRSSGTLAANRNSSELAKALRHEALEWESGNRCPETISASWTKTLHASNVAQFLAEQTSIA